MRWRAKCAASTPAVNGVAPFIVEHRYKRPQRRLLFAHCREADHDAEHKPSGWFVLEGLWRPGETRPADNPTVDTDGIGPIKTDRLVGRCDCPPMRRRGAHIPGYMARRAVRRGSWGSSTTANSARSKRPDMNQRPGALFCRNGDRVSEGIADLTEHQRPERRRQIKPRRNWRAAADFGLCRAC